MVAKPPILILIFVVVAAGAWYYAWRAQESGQRAARAQMDIEPVNAPFAMAQPVRPAIPAKQFDIRVFGAMEGGEVKNTEAIRRAIEAAAQAGGGRVLIPPGIWLTGAIHLENNIELHLLRGAEIRFSQDVADYLPVVFSRHEGIECFKYSAFIYADGKTNIAITGEGTLNGQGKPWWDWKVAKAGAEKRLYEMGAQGVPVEQRVFDGREGLELRPAFFQPMHCSNVLVEGVTFLYGAFWTITPTYCDNVIVRHVRIQTEGSYGHVPNGDGVNPSSSRNVLIEHCTFDTGDDCVAIKAGRDVDGLRVGRPTENVVIRHCRGLRGHGGIVMGSETSGGIRNIYGFDCEFHGTDRIVRIKTARGRGGVIENLWFRSLVADTIEQEAIHINMLYSGTRFPSFPVTRTTPMIRNVHYDDIRCTFAKRRAVEILGLPEAPPEFIYIHNITMRAAQGIACADARSVSFTNVNVAVDKAPVVQLTDCSHVTLDSVAAPAGVEPLLHVDGARSNEIRLLGSSVREGRNAIRLGAGARRHAVSVGK